MDDPRDLYRKAGEMAGAIMEKIDSEQLFLPTPCPEWNVSALINHIVNSNLRLAGRLTGGYSPEPDVDVLSDYPSSDFYMTFNELTSLFDQDGFLQRAVPTPFGDGSGAQLIAMLVTELTTHSWDLATATGQPADLDPELVTFASAMLRAESGPRQSGGPFGPAQPVSPQASPSDQLAALAGRVVPAAG
jgi:uncharacterized protein (TIGR03086 family)